MVKFPKFSKREVRLAYLRDESVDERVLDGISINRFLGIGMV